MLYTKDSFRLSKKSISRRFFLFSLIFCMMLAFTACASSKDNDAQSNAAESSTQSTTQESTQEISQTIESSESETMTDEESTESTFENGSTEESSSAALPNTTSGEPNDDEKVVYLTIDDGPSSNTDAILNILDQYDAKATWFVTSQYMEGNALSDKLKEIHDRGHAVGVHTFSHRYQEIYQSVDAYMSDYNKMNTIIVNATGEDSHLFRFPGGSNASYNKNIRTELIQHVKSEGLIYYDWNAFTGDTDGLSCSEMVSKAVKESSYNNKTILLMHDVPNKTAVVEALPQILSALKDKGYEFRALDQDVVPIQFEK